MKKYFFAIIFLAFNQAQANTGDGFLFKDVKENVVNFKTVSSNSLLHIVNDIKLTKESVKNIFGNPFIKKDVQEAWFYGVNINSNQKCFISFVFDNGGNVVEVIEMSSEKCEEALIQ